MLIYRNSLLNKAFYWTNVSVSHLCPCRGTTE